MNPIETKYEANRSNICHGDLILFRGTSLLSKTIQYFDSCYYNHVGLIFESGGRKFIIDSNKSGVRPDFLSMRIKNYKDFCIIRSANSNEGQIESAIRDGLARGDEGTKYDFALLLRIAIIKKTGINISQLGSNKRDICSEFARFYANQLADTYKDVDMITPQDFIRYKDEKFNILFDDSEK